MYKDEEKEVSIKTRTRTYYCDCCNKKLDTVENYARYGFNDRFPSSDYERHIQLYFSGAQRTSIQGIMCDHCWTLVQIECENMIDDIRKKYSYKKEDVDV